MTQYQPLIQNGRFWAEIDTKNGLLRIKRGRHTAVFSLWDMLLEAQAQAAAEGKAPTDEATATSAAAAK